MKASLKDNDSTLVSIFVNPAQFSPTEDLSTYPRPLNKDLDLLSSLSSSSISSSSSSSGSSSNSNSKGKAKGIGALFLPPVEALYPGGITTDVTQQRGTFIEVKGLQDSMEGKSRPGFFRGVATVVLKLFNIVRVRFHFLLLLLFSLSLPLSPSLFLPLCTRFSSNFTLPKKR